MLPTVEVRPGCCDPYPDSSHLFSFGYLWGGRQAILRHEAEEAISINGARRSFVHSRIRWELVIGSLDKSLFISMSKTVKSSQVCQILYIKHGARGPWPTPKSLFAKVFQSFLSFLPFLHRTDYLLCAPSFWLLSLSSPQVCCHSGYVASRASLIGL